MKRTVEMGRESRQDLRKRACRVIETRDRGGPSHERALAEFVEMVGPDAILALVDRCDDLDDSCQKLLDERYPPRGGR